MADDGGAGEDAEAVEGVMLKRRDAAYVLRSVLEPSAEIAEGFATREAAQAVISAAVVFPDEDLPNR